VNSRDVLPTFEDLPEPIRARIDRRADGCWIWTGSLRRDGYGQFDLRPKGRNWTAHRLVWFLLIGRPLQIGEMPENLHHRCEVRTCVNPEHLVPMDLVEHQREHHARDTCKAGHPFTERNTYVRRNGKRQCRTCKARRERERRERART